MYKCETLAKLSSDDYHFDKVRLCTRRQNKNSEIHYTTNAFIFVCVKYSAFKLTRAVSI